MPEVIILADGRSSGRHIIDPYSVMVGEETILQRQVRQLNRVGFEPVIVARDANVRARLGPMNYKPHYPLNLYDEQGGVAMIEKGLDRMWESQSTVVFGDVYFTDEAIQTIWEHKDDDFAVYGRSTDNKLTGTKWGEWFGFSLWDVHHEMAREASRIVSKAYLRKEWPRRSPWEWYFQMEGLPWSIKDVANVHTGPHWVEINDLTDDIDYESEIEDLRRNL